MEGNREIELKIIGIQYANNMSAHLRESRRFWARARSWARVRSWSAGGGRRGGKGSLEAGFNVLCSLFKYFCQFSTERLGIFLLLLDKNCVNSSTSPALHWQADCSSALGSIGLWSSHIQVLKSYHCCYQCNSVLWTWPTSFHCCLDLAKPRGTFVCERLMSIGWSHSLALTCPIGLSKSLLVPAPLHCLRHSSPRIEVQTNGQHWHHSLHHVNCPWPHIARERCQLTV